MMVADSKPSYASVEVASVLYRRVYLGVGECKERYTEKVLDVSNGNLSRKRPQSFEV